jgi:hypothetical protein
MKLLCNLLKCKKNYEDNDISAGATLAQINYCTTTVHCTENPIYVFPEMKLRSLVPNYYIHVSVRDLYIPRIGLPICLQKNRAILGIYKLLIVT